MPTALDISRRMIEEHVVPLLRRHHPALADRLAVGVHGTGSDVLGLDDAISRDHHWGPRAAVLLADADAGQVDAVRATLAAHMPPAFDDHPVHHDRANRTGLCVDHVSSYLHWFLGTSSLPQADEDWFDLCETDLLHVTGGAVCYDPSGAWTRVRERLSYYPDRVWRKRIADWCMYVTGRDAPYNLHRVSRRGDAVATQIYFGQTLRRTMELGFALERRYSPYPKWQHRLFRTLDGCPKRVVPLLDRLLAAGPDVAGTVSEASRAQWRRRVDLFVEINYIFAEKAAELGLAAPPTRVPFDDTLTDLTLYTTARQIYAPLPPEWLARSFNQIESWEKLARLVLFDAGDYFQKKVEKRTAG